MKQPVLFRWSWDFKWLFHLGFNGKLGEKRRQLHDTPLECWLLGILSSWAESHGLLKPIHWDSPKGCSSSGLPSSSLSLQNDIYEWSRDHRVHHKFSETDADPHNSRRGFFFSHVGWLLVRKHPAVKEKGGLLDLSDLKAEKLLMFQRRWVKWWWSWAPGVWGPPPFFL